jgi:multicomponent Na+:H+ antiporter subunit B
MAELHIILAFMIVAALLAVEMRGLLSSVISLGAVGMGLVLQFLLLKAPDLAITQLVVEILVLIILIKATVKMDRPSESTLKARWGYVICMMLFAGVFLWFGYHALMELPVFGEPLMRVSSYYIDNSIKMTGAANIVTSVLLDFRAYDTLGEVAILFTSVVGAATVMRKAGRKK